MGSTDLLWRLRSLMGPQTRNRVRVLSDRALKPIGSIKAIDGAGPHYALTFDDGPDPVWTPPLLDLLAEQNIRASFFLLVDRVHRFPQLLQRIKADGHEIALHGQDHTRLTTLPAREVSRRLRSAKSQLEDSAQVAIRWFRPPFGAQSPLTYAATRAAGLDVVVWGPFARDWVDGTPAEVAGRALGTVRSGDILLLHDGLEVPAGDPVPQFNRVEMFSIVLAGLRHEGLFPDSVGGLTGKSAIHRSAWFRP